MNLKKLVITLLMAIFLISGCNKIEGNNVNEVLSTIIYVDNNLSNTYMDGYELYLPQGIRIVDKADYNLKIRDYRNFYYLYVDTIAYYYQKENSFEEKKDHFYSQKFVHDNKIGYIDIVENDDNYFVVLMYNYAKMETYIEKENLSLSLINMCSILRSIKYNDKVIKKHIGNDGVVFQEEHFNIFESKVENDNFLKYEEEFGMFKGKIEVNDNNDMIDLDEIVE